MALGGVGDSVWGHMKFLIVQLVTAFLIVNGFVGLFYAALKEQREMLWQSGGIWRSWFVFGMTVSVITVCYMLLQAVLAAFYRPRRGGASELPRCTVVVPAYNEGRQVCDAISSVLDSDYPADKLEVIAVDDGSVDDTGLWIDRMAADNPGRVTALHQERNGGKKAALCRAIRASSRPVIITIDSDSIVEKSALRHLVLPFSDQRIGAVAGTIRVKNMQQGLLPRMLDVAFVFGCDFIRCAQSVIGSVLCTPGAISAYRRSVVLPLLDTWQKQTFLGVPAAIGEDRALTGLILRSGHQVVCQSNAVAFTEVPRHYCGLCKMLLRWTRGDVRESINMLKYVFGRWSVCDWKWSLFQLNILSQIVGVILPFVFIPFTFYTFYVFRDHVGLLLYYTFSVNGVWSLLPAAIYVRKRGGLGEALWALLYGAFSVLALSWICIYSVLTLRNSAWLTRNKA